MAIKARHGTFETNSSSTHSIVMCTKEEYEKFMKGELLYKKYSDEGFINKEKAFEIIKKDGYYDADDIEEMKSNEDLFFEAASESDIYDFETFGSDYESFYDEYKTPSGETVVAFGYYGYDC